VVTFTRNSPPFGEPVGSLSSLTTVTSDGLIPLNFGSALTAADVTMLYVMFPSMIVSSTASIVMVCGTFQVAEVNVTLPGEIVPSVASPVLRLIDTSAVGWLSSTIVNVVELPASVVVNPLVGATVMPAVSSSVFVADTSAGFMPLYFASGLLAAPLMML